MRAKCLICSMCCWLLAVFFPAGAGAQSSIYHGAAFFWPGNGDTIDLAGTNDGTLNGNAGFTNGLGAGAFGFNGSNDFINTSALVSNPQEFSLSLWFRTVATNGGVLIGFANSPTGNSTDADRNIYMDNSGIIHFGIWKTKAHLINSPTAYNDNSWHLAVGILSPETGLGLYLDGVLIGNDTTHTNAQVYDGWWRIGENTLSTTIVAWPFLPGSFYFTGKLQDVAVFNRALSSSEVAQIYSTGTVSNLFAATAIAPSIQNQSVQLNWSSVSNTAYQVEWTPSLPAGNWFALGTPVTATTTNTSVLDGIQNDGRFYRVAIRP